MNESGELGAMRASVGRQHGFGGAPGAVDRLAAVGDPALASRIAAYDAEAESLQRRRADPAGPHLVLAVKGPKFLSTVELDAEEALTIGRRLIDLANEPRPPDQPLQFTINAWNAWEAKL